MGSKSDCVMNAVVMAVIVGLVLPAIISPFATAEEIKPPSGTASLPLKGQFMHIMYHHHGWPPLMSSLIVALIMGLGVFLGYKLCPVTRLRKLV